MKIKFFKIKEIKNQDIVHGIFYCNHKELKKTKYGDPYISLNLSDSSGNIEAKLWKNTAHYDSKFSEGDIVVAKGSSNVYRKKIELNISHINTYNSSYDKYGFNSNSILSRIECDTALLWSEIIKFFKRTGDNSKIIKTLYYDYKKDILKVPYNIDSQSQLEGGYLNTINRALKVFEILINQSSADESVDSELIYSLIFLKNFHLICSYEKDIIYRLNSEGKDRGSSNVFHDCFKKYKKLAPSHSFHLLEKCIFDQQYKDSNSEKDLVEGIFSLINCVD